MATTKAPKALPSKRRAKLLPIHPADEKDAVKRFKKAEGYRLVVFSGERWHWYLCGLGILHVAPMGYQPLDTINRMLREGVKAFRKMEAARTSSNGTLAETELIAQIEAESGFTDDELLIEFAAVFYAATFPFYDHTFDDILAMTTQRSLKELTTIITDEMRLRIAVVPAKESEESTADADGEEGNLTTER